MRDTTLRTETRGGESGFTLVEALVAMVVLIVGLMAVTNLMLVAASSNSVANQGTAAVTSAMRAMDMLKSITYTTLHDGAGGRAFATDDTPAPRACNDPALPLGDFHCDDDVPGVGRIHTHWWVTTNADPRLLYIRVQSEGTGALSGARSRAQFTTFRSCTNADPVTGGCPGAP